MFLMIAEGYSGEIGDGNQAASEGNGRNFRVLRFAAVICPRFILAAPLSMPGSRHAPPGKPGG